MKPNKNTFDGFSTEELGALIETLTATYKERLEKDKRRKKAEEYEGRIYDLISEAQSDGFDVRINDAYIPKDSAVNVDW
jgi:uncharacterized protein (UPF0335 family)